MARFLNTRGRASLALARCDRCQRKFPIGELRRDGDNPALKVCRADYDHIDPWKLPPPAPDDYAVPGASPNDILLPEE
jgi:hypothetical protein